MSFEVIITDPEENSNQIIVNQETNEITVEISDPVTPDKIEIIVDEFSSQRAVDAANHAEEILQEIQDLVAGANHFRGNFETLEILEDAIPVGNAGDYAFLIKDDAPDDKVVWDSGDNVWRIQANGGGIGGNKILSIGVITRVGNVFTIPAGATWRINYSNYTNALPFTFTIPIAEAGFKRNDFLIATIAGFELILGTPYTDIVTTPDIPDEDNVIIIKEYKVDGGEIDDSAPPFLGDIFVKKLYYSELYFGISGIFQTYNIAAYYGHYIFQGGCTYFGSLDLYRPEDFYVGKWLILENKQLIPITIPHNAGTGSTKFIMPNNQNYKLMPGEKIILTGTREGNVNGNYKYLISNIKVEKSYVDMQDLDMLIEAINYTDAKFAEVRKTPQVLIYGNTILNNSHNGTLLLIMATCTLTVPVGLFPEFNCVGRTFTGATATWVEGSGITLDALKGKIQDPGRMSTFVMVGNTNVGFLEGELRS